MEPERETDASVSTVGSSVGSSGQTDGVSGKLFSAT